MVNLDDEAAVRAEAEDEFHRQLMAGYRRQREREDSTRRARQGGQLVYRRGGEHSFFVDMCRYAVRGPSDKALAARLMDHGAQLAHHTEFRTGLSTTEGDGSSFAPPSYVQAAFTAAAHPLRATANLCKSLRIPRNAPSFFVPAFTSGTGVVVASTQNQTLSETDPQDQEMQGLTTPIASKVVASRQLWDQAAADSQVDDVISSDMGEASGAELDWLVLNGSGSGQMTGLLNLSGVGTVSPYDSTAAAQQWAIAAGYQNVVDNRYRKPDSIVMHPRRWLAAFAGLADGQGRPLVLPSTFPAALAGTADDAVCAEWLGARVILDVNVPTTSGDGTQDYVIVGHSSDWLLYESEPSFEVFQETLASQMSVTLMALQYAGLAVRFPSSVCLVGPFDAPTTPGS